MRIKTICHAEEIGAGSWREKYSHTSTESDCQMLKYEILNVVKLRN